MGSISVNAPGLSPPLTPALPLFLFLSPPHLFFPPTLPPTFCNIMADRTSRLGVRRKEKTAESKVTDERDKDKGKEKPVKKPDKLVKKDEKTPEPSKADEKKSNGEPEGATGAEAKNSEGAGEFQPIELPPFEIVTG